MWNGPFVGPLHVTRIGEPIAHGSGLSMRLPDRSKSLLEGMTPHNEVEPDPIRVCEGAQARFWPKLARPAILNAPQAGSSLIAGAN
jgi:hypothetical protein